MKRIIGSAHDQSVGRSVRYEINLVEGFSGNLGIDVSGLSFASVTLQMIGCTGSSGNIEICQGSDESNIFPFPTPLQLTLAENTSIGVFNINTSALWLGIKRSSATFGSVGKIILTLSAKRSGAGETYISTSPTSSTPASMQLVEADGSVYMNDAVTTGGTINANSCLWLKIENIGSQIGMVTGESGVAMTLQPGESYYEEAQLLDKIYRQAKIDYNPLTSIFRITKKLRT